VKSNAINGKSLIIYKFYTQNHLDIASLIQYYVTETNTQFSN